MATEITPERSELGRCLESFFEASGRSRAQWAEALGVTRGAMWQWSDCRTVPRAEVWLKLLEDGARLPVPDEVVTELLRALDVPLGRLGISQASRKDTTLLDEIVGKASRDLAAHLATLPFRDALDVLDGAMSHARRCQKDAEWEQTLETQFERVLPRVVDTAVDPSDTDVDRAMLGAAAWRATYEWALARPDESISEGKVTRVVNDAVRTLVMEYGGSLRNPSY